MGTNEATDTRTISLNKLFEELNARPEQWLNILQTMGETTADELNDDPDGHANFQTLLAVALGEHTNQYDDEGNDVWSINLYDD